MCADPATIPTSTVPHRAGAVIAHREIGIRAPLTGSTTPVMRESPSKKQFPYYQERMRSILDGLCRAAAHVPFKRVFPPLVNTGPETVLGYGGHAGRVRS
jgi:hypothetical protein